MEGKMKMKSQPRKQRKTQPKEGTKKKNQNLKPMTEAPAVRMDAAGIDISPEWIYVAVDVRVGEPAVRCFGTVTRELQRIGDWLQSCGVRTVAMESTGVYWIPLYQVLEARGMEIFLVNARHYQNVPGRKTDVSDAAWLQYLHAVGLVRGSFRPAGEICALRTILRHRSGMVEAASRHIQQMQKSLDQMNVQIHRVLSDLTGVTGMAILDAILTGERAGERLAGLRQKGVQASDQEIIEALEGNYLPEHLFTLRQSLENYRHLQKQIAGCDQQIREMLRALEMQAGWQAPAPGPTKQMRTKGDEELRQEYFRIMGVDLTSIPGVNVGTVGVIVSEIGPDFSRFRSAAAFAAWLILCPHNTITGGQVKWSHTGDGSTRLGEALRMSAESFCRDKSYLGDFYRRMRAKLGAESAITAAAHKLARIIYALVTKKVAYDEKHFAAIEQRNRQKQHRRLVNLAAAMGYRLVPAGAAGVVS
jgi:transposase